MPGRDGGPEHENVPERSVRVLISRPDSQDHFCRALTDAGFTPVPVALTRTQVAEDAVIDQALDALDGASWLVVTSPRTVRMLQESARRRGDDLEALCEGTKVAAVGAATARALETAGLSAHLVAPPEQSDAAGLASVMPVPASPGERVVLPCSALASPVLREGLEGQGWQVQVVPVYTTVTATLTARQCTALSDPWPPVAVLTSGSNARALVELLGAPPSSCALVALGRPTAAALTELGLTVAAVAQAPTPEAVAAAVGETSSAAQGRKRPRQ